MLLFECLVTDRSRDAMQVKAWIEIDLENIIIREEKGNHRLTISRNEMRTFQEISVKTLRFLEKTLYVLVLEFVKQSSAEAKSVDLIFEKEQEYNDFLDIMSRYQQFFEFYDPWKTGRYQRLVTIRHTLHDQLIEFPTTFQPAEKLKKNPVTEIISSDMLFIQQLKEYFDGQVEMFRNELQVTWDEFEEKKRNILTHELEVSAVAIIRKDIGEQFESTKQNCEKVSLDLDELISLREAMIANEKEIHKQAEIIKVNYLQFKGYCEGYKLQVQQLLELQTDIEELKDLIAKRFDFVEKYDSLVSSIGSEIITLLSQLARSFSE
ncbi:MAG: hypothetical protein ACFFD4_39410 [Candidatus Odinarchaeota archaeon]